MDKIVVFNDHEQISKLLLQFLDTTQEELEADIDRVQEWLKKQSHLPEISSRDHISLFLKMDKGSIELAKKKLDMYYTVRTLMPEVFNNSHPKLPHMQAVANQFYMLPIPKHTEDGNSVIILGMKSPKIEDTPSYFQCMAHFLNVIEVRIAEELSIRDIFIFDFDGLGMAHAMKFTPTFLKQMSILLTEIYLTRVQHLHFINCPVSDFLIGLMRKFVSRKVSERIIVHDKLETLLEYIPKDMLPKEYGGTLETTKDELNELWKAKLIEYYWRFDQLSTLQVKEELRQIPLKNDDFLGYHGNFKKIEVD